MFPSTEYMDEHTRYTVHYGREHLEVYEKRVLVRCSVFNLNPVAGGRVAGG